MKDKIGGGDTKLVVGMGGEGGCRRGDGPIDLARPGDWITGLGKRRRGHREEGAVWGLEM